MCYRLMGPTGCIKLSDMKQILPTKKPIKHCPPRSLHHSPPSFQSLTTFLLEWQYLPDVHHSSTSLGSRNSHQYCDWICCILSKTTFCASSFSLPMSQYDLPHSLDVDYLLDVQLSGVLPIQVRTWSYHQGRIIPLSTWCLVTLGCVHPADIAFANVQLSTNMAWSSPVLTLVLASLLPEPIPPYGRRVRHLFLVLHRCIYQTLCFDTFVLG